MNAVIFAGPTLSRHPAKAESGFTFLPPAANGDVYRAVSMAPTAIGLVDGFFETVPAVWHKEILYALSQGIHVFGAGSMGALRAAELWEFGMVGVGAVFVAYRDNHIEDDDEVAVIHGPAELDYLPLSEAMVNVRATVDRAVSESIISSAVAAVVLQLTKATFYKERTWARVLEQLRSGSADGSQAAAFEAWLRRGIVDQKRLDAVEMLDAIRQLLAAQTNPFRASFEFEETADWRAAVHDFHQFPGDSGAH